MEWHYLSLAGLTLIAFGWFYQFSSLASKRRELQPLLPLSSAFGIALLVLDALWSNMMDVAVFNVLTFIGASLVFMADYHARNSAPAKPVKKGKRKK